MAARHGEWRWELIDALRVRAAASREELAALLSCDGETATALLRAADEVRAERVGKEVHLRALLEFSNHCRRNCGYCGLRREHRALRRYRMSPDDIVACAGEAVRAGYRTVVLQSGEDLWYSAPRLAEVVRAIKQEGDVAVTLSIGERTAEEYRLLREAGADRFLLRMETSSPSFYRALHPDSDWESRLECLRSLRRLGYQVGSGVIIGLPGQTIEMLADDLLFLQSLDLDMIGVGPFIPHPATPLADAPAGGLELALRFLACLRLLCQQALIPATTALGALAPDGLRRGLQAGANVVMPDCTPAYYRRLYELYPGRRDLGESLRQARAAAEELVSSIDRRVARDRGDSWRAGMLSAVRPALLAGGDMR